MDSSRKPRHRLVLSAVLAFVLVCGVGQGNRSAENQPRQEGKGEQNLSHRSPYVFFNLIYDVAVQEMGLWEKGVESQGFPSLPQSGL